MEDRKGDRSPEFVLLPKQGYPEVQADRGSLSGEACGDKVRLIMNTGGGLSAKLYKHHLISLGGA